MSQQLGLFDTKMVRVETMPPKQAEPGAAGDSFDLKRLVESFPILAAAEGGTACLRELVLGLAVRGILVPQLPGEGDSASLVEQLRRASEKAKEDPKREAQLRIGLESKPQAPWAVPPTWRFLRLEQLSAGGGIFCDGDWVESKDQDPSGEIRLTQLADVGDGVWRDRSDRFMNRPTAERLRCTFLQQGDILIARMPDPIGRACIFPGDRKPCATVVDVAVLRIVLNVFEQRFVMMAVNSPPVRNAINKLIAGTTRQRVSRGNLANILIPLPPLAEQKRIVAKVDELMALIDALEAQQAKARQAQARFRASALDALTRAAGPEELAEAWQRVAGNINVLLDNPGAVRELRLAIIDLATVGRLTSPRHGAGGSESKQPGQPGLPAGWRWVDCESLCDPARIITYGVIKLGNETPGGVPTLRSSNVRWLHIDETGLKRISPELADEFRRTKLRGGEVVLTVRGTLGGIAVVPAHLRDGNISREVAVLPFRAEVDPQFMALCVAAPRSQRWLTKVTKGIAYEGINIGDLRRLPLPLPPPEEQKRIVAKVDALMKLCDDLEAKLKAKEATAAKLVEAVVRELVGASGASQAAAAPEAAQAAAEAAQAEEGEGAEQPSGVRRRGAGAAGGGGTRPRKKAKPV